MKKSMLSSRQHKAILALCESPTKEAAARSAGISRTTLFQWLSEKAFLSELERVRSELYAEGLAVLKSSSSKAAGVLYDLLGSEDQNVRRLAASQVLTLGLKAAEMESLEARLNELEEYLRSTAILGLSTNHKNREKNNDA